MAVGTLNTCYRHPDRETNVACSRCERPICPDCMTPSPVGMRCPECAGEKTKVKRPSYNAGGGAGSLSETAPATFALIVINVAAFVVQLATGGGATSFDGGGSFTENLALCGNAVGSGGPCAPPPIAEAGGEWWRIISGGFLHGGFFHLGVNMFVLFVLGRLIEPAIGTPRLVAIYFISLIAGSMGAIALSEPFQNTVGASGAIYGLFAATLLIARNRGFDQVVMQLGFWLVLNLVITFSVPGISIGGHLGGLVGGVIVALVTLRAERSSGRRLSPPEIAVLAALGVAFFAGAVLVANSGAGVAL